MEWRGEKCAKKCASIIEALCNVVVSFRFFFLQLLRLALLHRIKEMNEGFLQCTQSVTVKCQLFILPSIWISVTLKLVCCTALFPRMCHTIQYYTRNKMHTNLPLSYAAHWWRWNNRHINLYTKPYRSHLLTNERNEIIKYKM